MVNILSRTGIDPSSILSHGLSESDSLINHVLAHYAFCLKNKVKPEEATTQHTGIGNGRGTVRIHDNKNVDRVIISYPLVLILKDFLEQTNDFIGYQGQLKIAKKYNITNLGTVYRIAKNLGCVELLEWKYISLSVEVFERLQAELENNFDEYAPRSNSQKMGRNGESYFRLMEKIGITNPEYLYGAISSLGLVDKLNYIKIRVTNIDTAKKAIEIAKEMSRENNGYFSIDAVISIAERIGIEEKSIWRIRAILKSFGFTVDPIPRSN